MALLLLGGRSAYAQVQALPEMPELPAPNVAWERPQQEFFEEAPAVDSVLAPTVARSWEPQVLPAGVMWRSYLAGAKESRLASVFNYEKDEGWIWDISLGGRVALWRYGTTGGLRPEGWEIEIEGAGLPRLDLEDERDLVSADFRAGLPIVYSRGPYQTKFGYYHLSSHLGDEYWIRHPDTVRINYSRDVLIFAQSYYWTDAIRIYAEAGWAFYSDVAEPWEFQFGWEYLPPVAGHQGAPFAAVNAHLREEVDFGGNLVVQAGWQWMNLHSGHIFRTGLQYYNGKSDQFEFYNESEDKVGLAVWYDY